MRREVEIVRAVEASSGFPGQVALWAPREDLSAKRPRLALISFLATTSLLLLAAPAVLAQTPRSIDLDGIAPPAAMALLALSTDIPAGIATEVPDQVVPAEPLPDAPIVVERSEAAVPVLEALLTLRARRFGLSRTRTTDELIAAAVALGNNPDLEPRNPFRKHSRDLFRTERPVTIGQTDMVVRLRLRAKARRAVSVEFRY